MIRLSTVVVALFSLCVSGALVVSGLRAANPTKLAADGRNPLRRTDDPIQQTEVEQSIRGEWSMHLPAGFTHRIALIPAGPDRFRLEPKKLNSSGIYEVRNGKLVIVQPNDRRLLGFEWQIKNNGEMVLVGQPPVGKTGSNYLGATLTRKVK